MRSAGATRTRRATLGRGRRRRRAALPRNALPEIFGDVPRSIKRNADRRASQRADARRAARSTLTNGYYNLLLNLPWTLKEWDGPMQFEDPSGKAPRSRRDRPEISPDVRPGRRVDRRRYQLTTASERS